MGVKLPLFAFSFHLENDTITFLLENQSLYRIDSLAQPIWGDEGLLFTLDDCLGPDAQVVSDNNNGIIVLWNECVSGVRGKLINKNGEIGIVTDVDESNIDYLSNFVVSSNYPNPFNPQTNIKFDIANTSFVSVKVYNTLGKEITTLLEKEIFPGSYTISWEAKDSNGKLLPSGVYLIRLSATSGAGKYTKTIKAVLLK